jgi:hypothetical protein
LNTFGEVGTADQVPVAGDQESVTGGLALRGCWLVVRSSIRRFIQLPIRQKSFQLSTDGEASSGFRRGAIRQTSHLLSDSPGCPKMRVDHQRALLRTAGSG